MTPERARQNAEYQAMLRETLDPVAATDALSYGGSVGNAWKWAHGYGAAAEASQFRKGYQWDDRRYDESSLLSQQARGQQERGLGMLREQMDMSRGSAASDAVRYGAGRAAEMQRSLAGLAAGGQAAQIAAASQAQQGNLLAGQQAAQQAQMIRSREAQDAALQYGAAASAMRGQDMSRQAADQQLAIAQGLSRTTNMGQNADREASFEGLRTNVLTGQQRAMIGQQQDAVKRKAGQLNLEAGQRNLDAASRSAMTSAAATGTAGVAKQMQDFAEGMGQQQQRKGHRDPYGQWIDD